MSETINIPLNLETEQNYHIKLEIVVPARIVSDAFINAKSQEEALKLYLEQDKQIEVTVEKTGNYLGSACINKQDFTQILREGVNITIEVNDKIQAFNKLGISTLDITPLNKEDIIQTNLNVDATINSTSAYDEDEKPF